MSIVYVSGFPSGIEVEEDGQDDCDTSYDQGVVVVQRYHVRAVDDSRMLGLVAASAVVDGYLNGWGTPYASGLFSGEYWTNAILTNAKPKPLGNDGVEWNVSCTYKNVAVGEVNPLAEQYKFYDSFDFDKKASQRDFNGDAFINRARLPYPEPIMLPTKKQVWILEKNVSFADEPVFLQNYFGAINSSAWRNAAQYCLKYDFYTKEPHYGHRIAGDYYTIKHRWTLDPDDHQIKVINEGAYIRDPSTGEIKAADKKTGQNKNEPDWLNEDGSDWLPAGAEPIIDKYFDGPQIDFSIFDFLFV